MYHCLLKFYGKQRDPRTTLGGYLSLPSYCVSHTLATSLKPFAAGLARSTRGLGGWPAWPQPAVLLSTCRRVRVAKALHFAQRRSPASAVGRQESWAEAPTRRETLSWICRIGQPGLQALSCSTTGCSPAGFARCRQPAQWVFRSCSTFEEPKYCTLFPRTELLVTDRNPAVRLAGGGPKEEQAQEKRLGEH
jgi:hypothetical protein